MINKKQKADCIVGKYFHSINQNGELIWQGKVVGEPGEGKYLIQLFSWLDGHPTEQRLIKLDEMTDWLFYSTHDDFMASYNYGAAGNLCKIKNPHKKI